MAENTGMVKMRKAEMIFFGNTETRKYCLEKC